MKNREYTIINVYTQANGEKIAISMLQRIIKGYTETIKPTTAVEKYGKIEGEINSYWGKLPVVLVPVEQFAALKKEYDVIDFRGPVECTRIRESKPRPDAAALKLYKAFAADAAAPQDDAYITVDGYRFPSGAGEYLLKALKREYNFTKSDIAAAYALTLDNAAADAEEQPAAPVVDAPAAGYMSGETTRGRVYYINNNDKPVSRVVDLERINYNSQLPMWIMPENDCDFIVFQLSNNIFFRANGCCIPENYRAALRGDYSVYDEKTIANDMANAAAIPAKQFTPEYWPNMAVVNAYQAAGMVEEAKKLLSIREEIEKTREEKKKARQQENERKELERKQAEEKQLNEAAAQFINGGTITAEDVVKLCDRENITINPRTRHNLLEVVSYFENNGSTIHYRYHGKRKPVLNGCFSVVKALRERLTQAAADMAEAPAADVVEAPVADMAEAPAADVAEAPAADMAEAPAADEPDPDAIGEIVTIPASQKNAFNDAVILAQAARIKSNYEAMKQQAAADTFADAITAYCAALEAPAAPAWAPEIITVTPCPAWDDTPAADAAPAPRRRRFAPRLRPVLRRLGRVAAVVLPLLIVALFMGASTGRTASAPAAVTTCQASAATVAQVVELPALTVTASSLTTAPATPSPVKKLATPSPVKKAAADAVTLPNQKTASDIATATAPAANGLQPTPPDGLTICAGTAWAYTMMNWA